MSVRKIWTMLLSLVLLASPATAWAFGGGAGCANLPEYDRAVGALEGLTGACDMSVEQARRIVAQQGQPAVDGQVAGTVGPSVSTPHARRRHRRTRPLQP